ncbi:MAG TPA: helix-turn-helix transcriptional regulator [Eubacteriales bacterium]|mgnify:CR=1 FL=1|nr:helix-turn-helix transcriptional regulator [Eubacteriales bacterium]
MLDLVKIGNKIKIERTEKNISQEQLSEMLYVSRQAVSKWEMGMTMPSIDNICFLVEIFGTTIDDLLCLNDNKPISAENLRENENNPYVVGAIVEGNVDFDLSEEMYRFSPEERIVIVRAVKNFDENGIDNSLIKNLNRKYFWLKLTDEEKQLLDIDRYKEEIKNDYGSCTIHRKKIT